MLLLYYYIHTYICIGTRHFAHRVFQYMDKRVSAAENGDDDVVRSFAFSPDGGETKISADGENSLYLSTFADC